MKRLYVTDLDGTLLTKEQTLPDASRASLNRMLDAGLLFTAATGRSQRSACQVLRGLRLSQPLILLNGCLLYDMGGAAPLSLSTLTAQQCRDCIAVYEKHGLHPVVYTCDADNAFYNYYREMGDGPHYAHFGPAVEGGDPRYKKIDHFEQIFSSTRCFFVVALADEEAAKPVAAELAQLGLPYHLYFDIYTGGFFLECCSADKGIAALAVKERVGADELVVFGDNLNDLPMMIAADRAVAVQDAVPEVLAVADHIVPCCDEQGVVAFIENEFGGR